MRRKIYHAILLVPVLLVLLHSVTPHHHFSLDGQTFVSAKNQCPQTLLSQLFQIDLGANHLEDFKTYQYDVDFLPDVFPLTTWQDLLMPAAEAQVFVDYFIPDLALVRNSHLAGSHSLRAPPRL